MPHEGQQTRAVCEKCRRITLWEYSRETFDIVYGWILKCAECGERRPMWLRNWLNSPGRLDGTRRSVRGS